ncbi:MAG: glycosyltransferase family 4 protein [Psychrobacillus sp.]
MNILFVATVYRHLVNFHIPYMQYFQKLGYTVYAISNGDEDQQILIDLGIHCIDIAFSRNPFSPNNIQAYFELKALFKQKQFSLIHVNSPISALLTRLVYRKYKVGPIVYTAHGFHFFEGAPKQNWLIYYPLERIAARWTDHLFVMNNEDYCNAQKFMAKDKLSFVHGVGVEFTNQPMDLKGLKKSINLSEEAIVISYIAELNSNKNHNYLLRNWKTIKKHCPKALLLIIGTGELNEELEEYVKAHKLKDVQFLGHRRDVEQLLQLTHINTLLSYREGLPKSTMEAMYMGIPNIVTDTRGLKDLIRDGHSGYVIPQNNDALLVDKFVLLIQSAELRIKMGNHAKEMIKPYLLENVLPEYSTVYKSLLK